MSTDQRIDHGQFADTSTTEPVGSRSNAVGVTAAAVALIMIGLFHFLQGLAALVDSTMFIIGDSPMVVFTLTSWGWIHIILGALFAGGGLFLFTGRSVARFGAVALLAVGALASLAWMPYYPVLSVLIVVMDAYLIWALTAHREVLPLGENEDWD